MAPRANCLFSYYGSKSHLVQHYPKPKFDTIIEPFAGGGVYSLRYAERQVILNELNPEVYGLWKYLIETPVDDVLEAVPRSVKKGDKPTDIVPSDSPEGLRTLIRANVNMGTLGTAGKHEFVTWFAELHWHQVHQRLEKFLPKIRHWSVTNLDYAWSPIIPNATYFVDPPYNNSGGGRYRFKGLDYEALGNWCRSLPGQVLVCENEGADWLPFKPLARTINRGGANKAMEMLWTNDSDS